MRVQTQIIQRRGRALIGEVSPKSVGGCWCTTRVGSGRASHSTGMANVRIVFDISWDVAYIFVWGSVVWVINAFFSFLPDVAPSTEFNNEILVGGGVTAFIGATIFEVGSILLMLEAINENRSSCFGWATRQLLSSHKHGETEYEKGDAFSDKGLELAMVPDAQHCSHHHRNSKNLVGSAQASSLDHMNVKTQHAREKSWSWWPSSYDLRTHYLHDLGFIACSWQLFGASIFWISGFTALPGINNKLSAAALNGAYWFPQVLGGFGFIVSGVLFMIETQKHWWQPAPRVLGWHIGLWNLIGGVGFTLCPAFGFDTSSWAQYQAGCSTFWGSWAFLIGSLIQLYESLEKNPVELDRSST